MNRYENYRIIMVDEKRALVDKIRLKHHNQIFNQIFLARLIRRKEERPGLTSLRVKKEAIKFLQANLIQK